MLGPDVAQSLESLEYWLERHGRLPVYRRRARGEARRMIAYWQAKAASDVRRDPLAALTAAGSAVRVGRRTAGYHVHRATSRLAASGFTVMAVCLAIAVFH